MNSRAVHQGQNTFLSSSKLYCRHPATSQYLSVHQCTRYHAVLKVPTRPLPIGPCHLPQPAPPSPLSAYQ
ncbi:hypothetical protein HYQ46_006255 [Verticillium longisporum]|nr:hypothetical protein HYQ46_006255 [Verticillium longisporum]